MTRPTSDEVHVACEALRTEGRLWEDQSEKLRLLSGKTAELEYGRVEAGLFQIIVGPYNDVIDVVTARCAEGSIATGEIAGTLRRAADTYEAEDQAGAHQIKDVY